MARQMSFNAVSKKRTSLKKIFSGISAALLLAVSHNASAMLINLEATINSDQEVPGTGSLATGFASMTFDDITNQLNWNIIFADLTAQVTGMHFHGAAAAGSNAGVQVNIGAISGLNSPTIGSVIISDLQEIDLLNGLFYINIHTTNYPGGEIRGQVLVSDIPEPSTLLLFGAALTGLGFARLKKNIRHNK